MKKHRTQLEQQLFEALMEASAMFDDSKDLYSNFPGTYEVVNQALSNAVATTIHPEA